MLNKEDIELQTSKAQEQGVANCKWGLDEMSISLHNQWLSIVVLPGPCDTEEICCN